MSRKYNRKEQNLSGLTVVNSTDVFDTNGKIKKGVKVYGKVSKDIPYLTSYNAKTKNHKYKDSLDNLSKKNKQEIVEKFENKKTRVCYVVEKRS